MIGLSERRMAIRVYCRSAINRAPGAYLRVGLGSKVVEWSRCVSAGPGRQEWESTTKRSWRRKMWGRARVNRFLPTLTAGVKSPRADVPCGRIGRNHPRSYSIHRASNPLLVNVEYPRLDSF